MMETHLPIAATEEQKALVQKAARFAGENFSHRGMPPTPCRNGEHRTGRRKEAVRKGLMANGLTAVYLLAILCHTD